MSSAIANRSRPGSTDTTYRELWLARRLGRPDLYAGVTDAQERRKRLLALCAETPDLIVGRGQGRPGEPLSVVVARLYGLSA
jgi:hypothetical protein